MGASGATCPVGAEAHDDLSVITRLPEIAKQTATVEIEASIMTMRGDLPEPRELLDEDDSLTAGIPSLESEATIVLATVQLEVWNRDDVARWTDQVI